MHQISYLNSEQKKWFKINYQSRGTCNTNIDTRIKTTVLKSSSCDYSGTYILVKGWIKITVVGDDAAARQAIERNKGVIFKNCASFINRKSKINNTEIDNAKDIDIVMSKSNLIEYSDNCSKISRSLWKYYKDEPKDNLTDSESFNSKMKIKGNTPADGNTKDIEIIVPLKHLSIWRTLEMPLINCEVNLILTWSSTCVITNSTGAGRFATTDTKLYIPVVI